MKKGSIDDFTSLVVGGGLSIIALFALSMSTSFEQDQRDTQRQRALAEHKATLETRSILQTHVRPGYTLGSYLVDAKTLGKTDQSIRVIQDTLNKTDEDANWYYQYGSQQGYVYANPSKQPNLEPPQAVRSSQADPQARATQADPEAVATTVNFVQLPGPTENIRILFHRYDAE